MPGLRTVRHPHLRTALVAALLACAAPAVAQDLERGRLLYETHCGACHYERMHARERSAIRSLSDLRDTVARWAPQTKQRFTLDEIEEVVQYLDRKHYRLGEGARSSAGPAR